MSPYTIAQAETRADVAAIRTLFMEYQRHIKIDLDFQDFGAELAELPGKYAPPLGRLLLAKVGNSHAGCVAIYSMTPEICELKRLYVRPEFAGKGIGAALFEKAMAEAKAIGYTHMRLDSLRRMTEAEQLYRRYGFCEIPPYNDNPHADVYYMERKL